jgi:hypothetical protein
VARRIESHFLTGPAGRLEALLEEPDDQTPRLAALVCHPHPLYGGTLHNKVVYRIARGLRHAGVTVLRFNFRGVGASEGEHANMIGEIEDARAALDWLRQRYSSLPFALAGFSFGAGVITRLGYPLRDVAFLMAVGYPTQQSNPYLDACPAPKVFVQSTRDQFGPRPELEAVYAKLAGPKELIWIEAEDHFFRGGLDQLEQAVRSAVDGGKQWA